MPALAHPAPVKLSAVEQAARDVLIAQSLPELSTAIAQLEQQLPAAGDEARYARGVLAMARYERATQLYEGMLRLAAENAANPAQVSALARQALSDYEKAAEYNPRMTSAWLGAAKILLLPGADRARALIALNEILKLDPKHSEALRLRGLLRTQTGQPAEALADFEAAARLDPKNPAIFEAQASALAGLSKLEEAEAALAQAIQLAPKSVSTRLALARLHVLRRDLDAALKDLGGLLAESPGNVAALALRAGLLEQTGQVEPLLIDLDALVRVQPQAMDVQRKRAALLARLNRLDTAIDAAQTGLLKATSEAAGTARRLELGVLMSARNDHARAVEQFSAALAGDPNLLAALLGRGDALAALGKYQQAVADYGRVIEKNPRDVHVLNNLAWILATAPGDGDRDGRRAVDLAEEAARLTDQRAPNVLGTLAAAYAERGDFRRAVQVAQRAQSLTKGAERDALTEQLARYQAEQPWREARRESPQKDPK